MSEARLEEIIAEYPTPFHIYDAKGIVDNIRRFIKAFSWAKDFKRITCRKSNTESLYHALITKRRVGADCSSLAELILCEKVGITGDDIIFSSNDTPYEEYAKAMEMGAIINLDDITHVAYLEKHGELPNRLAFRYNPGPLKHGGNTIIGLPEEAKYGMTGDQIIEASIIVKIMG